MRKYIILALLFMLIASTAFAYTETFYMCNGGNGTLPETNACATAWDANDFNNTGNWAAIDADDGKLGPNDNLIVMDDGGTYQNIGLNIHNYSGLEGKPITISAQAGDTPVFDYTEIITGWTNQSGNIYKATVDSTYLEAIPGGMSQGFVMVDTTYDSDHWPAPVASLGAMVQNSWWYDDPNNILYVWLWNDADPSGHTMRVYTYNGLDSPIRIYNQDYITVEGITFQNAPYILWISGSAGTGADNIIFDNVVAHGASVMVVRVEGDATQTTTSYVTIKNSDIGYGATGLIQFNGKYGVAQNNTIHHSGPYFVDWQQWLDAGVIMLGDNNTTTKNKIYNVTHGILFEGWGSGVGDGDVCHDNTASYNKIYDTAGTGVFINGDSNTVFANVIYGITSIGIYLDRGGEGHWGAGAYTDTARISIDNLIYNNIIDGGTYGIEIHNAAVTGTQIKNNILNDNSSAEMRDCCTGYSNVWDYNLYGRMDLEYNGTPYDNWATYKAASSQDANSPTPADPVFTNEVTDDYSLQITSPAIDVGINLGATYINILDPDSSWPDSVATLNQTNNGDGSEIGAFVYPDSVPPDTVGNLRICGGGFGSFIGGGAGGFIGQ